MQGSLIQLITAKFITTDNDYGVVNFMRRKEIPIMINTLSVPKGKKIQLPSPIWSIPGTSNTPIDLVTYKMGLLNTILSE